MNGVTQDRDSESSNKPAFRPLSRQATFILPSTGQRIRGSSISRSPIAEHVDDRTPLLPRTSDHDGADEEGRPKWREQTSAIVHAAHAFVLSETGKGVLKCSLAYFIGTLATFVPAISAFLGHQDGKHMVATITVYFHPARTRGSMIEAFMLSMMAFSYAAFVSITSMSVAVLFEDVFHSLYIGHAIILVVFCGGGLGFVGWVKQRQGDALVNVACSLASLAVITILTKEGSIQQGDLSFQKIVQVLKMIIMGVIATMTVCFAIYPLSARIKLRQSMVEMTDSVSDMLEIITDSFVYGSADGLEQQIFLDASNRNKNAYKRMDKLLKEAKYEHYLAGTEKEYILQKKLVRCIQDVAQSIGGLRSAAALQFDLLKQPSEPSRVSSASAELWRQFQLFTPTPNSNLSDLTWPVNAQPATQTSESSRNPQTGSDDGSISPHSPADIFERFIFHLGPSMQSLAYTLKEILGELPYGPAPDFRITLNSKFRTSLECALELYSGSRNNALNLIYGQKDLIVMKSSSIEVEADIEEVAASCGHFSFSLQQFGEQLKDFLEILDELQLEVEERPDGRSWGWIKFWKRNNIDDSSDIADICEPDNPFPPGPCQAPGFEYPSPQTRKVLLRFKIWKALRIFRREDVKFAIKVGVGAAIYAFPSFLKSTRPIYSAWRGEWGLLSYMLVCSMTKGASNTTGYARLFGTCLGAACALTAWRLTDANAIFLGLVGWVMSFCTAYLILAKGRGPMGRFIMLTYNLIVLYAYSLANKEGNSDEDEGGESPIVTSIALHRVVAVLSGVIWGIIVTRVIWPASAKRKLKDGLSLLWLRMSVIWKRDPLSKIIQDGSIIPYFDQKEKLELQRFLSRLESLQRSATSEFSLKRPFPDAAYKALLARTRRMLDAFQAMNLEIMKNLTASEGEATMLKYTLPERIQLSARISHLLSVLASSMKLGYSLNDVLPNTDHARDRLLARLHQYRKDVPVSSLSTDEDYALLYAYALVTAQLSKEIVALMDEVRKLFGEVDEEVISLQ